MPDSEVYDWKYLGILLLIMTVFIGGSVMWNVHACKVFRQEATTCLESNGQYICSRYECFCYHSKK